jgi:BMFP domain-containing protein YqiC
MWRKIGAIVLATLLTVLLWQTRVSAQSNANLQADLYQLRAQVSQLQAQVAQLSGRAGVAPRANAGSVPSRATRGLGATDAQMFDRLAVLAIEAKERLNALEARVARLEKR